MLRSRLASLFRADPESDVAAAIYRATLQHSRNPIFYAAWGVPDTLDGRFESLCLHLFLVLRRLRAEGGGQAALSQELVDALIADMDRCLREQGVGDLGVGKRVRAMAEAWMGRLAAYDRALDEPADDALAAALRRNLWGSLHGVEPEAPALAAATAYARRAEAALSRQPIGALRAAGPAFPAPAPGEVA